MNRFADVVKHVAAWLVTLLMWSHAPARGTEQQAPFWVALAFLVLCLGIFVVLALLAFAWLTT